MNRARAKRRFLAWERYYRRYPDLMTGVGTRALAYMRWVHRAHRHRTTHAGIQAMRDGRAS